MTDKKKNGWIKFVPSLDLPKERVSITYDTHDERGVRYAYGYFQFYNGTCGCFWKDGNEQPKVVKAEDIKYWMPVPSLDVQEEPVSEELETELNKYIKGHFTIDTEQLDKFGIEEEDYMYSMDKSDMLELVEHFTKWQKEKEYTCCEEAFEDGAKWKKEEMMKDAFTFSTKHNVACILASECLRNHGWFNRERDFNDLFRHLSCVDKLFEGKFSGKTKVIVIKED